MFEGDITACFDEIDHTALMGRVRHRIGDKRVLGLVKAFLKAGVLSEDGVNRDTITGTPQGGILSPLLANIALSVLDEHFAEASGKRSDRNGHAGATPTQGPGQLPPRPLRGRLRGHGRRHPRRRRGAAGRGGSGARPMGLRLSEEKTRVCHIDEGFDFLGLRIQRHKKRGTNKRYVYTYPSKKALASVMDKVEGDHAARNIEPSLGHLLRRLNPVLRGWTNYFRHGVSKATFAYLRLHLAAGRRLARGTSTPRQLVGTCNGATSTGGGPSTDGVVAVQPGNGRDHPLPLPGSSHPHAVGDDDDRANGRMTQRHELVESRMR